MLTRGAETSKSASGGGGCWRLVGGRPGEAVWAMAGRSAARKAVHAPRILVVDEVAAVRAALGAVLRRAGYEVLACDGGPAALEILERRGADLVLTDLHLPEMTGWDLARAIRVRNITNGSGLPVCLGLYSAVLGAFTREQLARAQVDFTLTRPRDPAAVLEAVERALAWSGVG